MDTSRSGRVCASAQAQSTTTINETDCTAAKLGDSIPVSAIGEPVSAVTLSAPRWNPAAKNAPAYCSVNGAMAPVDKSPTAKPINFHVAFPPAWNGRAVQLGGGGINGTIPGLTGGPGSPLGRGYVTYGSDSGHQIGGFAGPGGPWPRRSQRTWAGGWRTGGEGTCRAESRGRLGAE